MEAPTKTVNKAYGSRTPWRRRKSGWPRWGLMLGGLVVVMVTIGLLIFLPLLGLDRVSDAGSLKISKSAVLELWQKSDWMAVIKACDGALSRNTLSAFFLGMKGLASFYAAIDLPEGSSRTSLLDSTIISIRKALTQRDSTLGGRIPRGELEYVLAKAYFHKGRQSRDLAAAHMEASLSHGYVGSDTHEYLAMTYASLGETNRSIPEFEKAMIGNKSAFLMIAAAEEYATAGRPQDAERLLQLAVTSTRDVIAREKARLLLVIGYFGQSRFAEVETILANILIENPDSAEAHYRLGLLYQIKGDPVHARAEWRKAVALDPMHAASRQKLAERS